MNNKQFMWNFFRLGGLDQVSLETAEELQRLSELDPKLWVVLSCPTGSLVFDKRTLELLDARGEGRIHISDVQEAVSWTVERLADPATLTERRQSLPLTFIRQDTAEGCSLLAAARHILRIGGRAENADLTQEDACLVRREINQQLLNGDGVIAPHSELDADLNAFIKEVVKATGGVLDACGEVGANQECLDGFMQRLRAWNDWHLKIAAHERNLTFCEKVGEAYGLLQELAPKIDDFFTRSLVVQFDGRSLDALNPPETFWADLGGAKLSLDDPRLLALPLAHVAGQDALPLGRNVNPAWQDKVARFTEIAVIPLLGERSSLTLADWAQVRANFADYAALASQKPTPEITGLESERLQVFLNGDLASRLQVLLDKDRALALDVAHLDDIERLVLFHKHLFRLLMNFVSFFDFYDLSKSTTFQIGTLYIDGRSCTLTILVENIETHALAAQFSYLCLVYCSCVKCEGGQSMNIVAAITAGDSEFLLPGRHGVFVDREGGVWDAALIKLVENPISIKTAILSPYKKITRLINTQVEKFSAAKNEKALSGMVQGLQSLTSSAAKPVAGAAPQPFDIGKSVGILAAVGLALGALGTAAASITSSLLALAWWEVPLLVVGIFGLISGLSMFTAWLKLRKRTLGPVLDASGWAVNSQIPINYTVGANLTDSAKLPENAQRRLSDPFTRKPVWKRWVAAILILCFALGSALGLYWAWKREQDAQPVRSAQLVQPVQLAQLASNQANR